MKDMDSSVAVTEVAAVLGLSAKDLRGFAAGPFASDRDGDERMRLRAALGAFVVVALGFRDLVAPRTAMAVAAEAADGAGADLGERDRTLVVE